MIGTDGSRSDGFRMKALPHANAGQNFHIGIIAGKLKGVIPATTPSGWRMEYMSMPGPAPSVNSPLSICGAPMQNSATSSPRITSPLASGSVLPCSRDQSLRELVHVAVQKIDELHHNAGTALWICCSPGRLSSGCIGNRRVHLVLAGESDLAPELRRLPG